MKCELCKIVDAKHVDVCPATNIDCEYRQHCCDHCNLKIKSPKCSSCHKMSPKESGVHPSKTIVIKLAAQKNKVHNNPLLDQLSRYGIQLQAGNPFNKSVSISVWHEDRKINLIFLDSNADIKEPHADEVFNLLFFICDSKDVSTTEQVRGSAFADPSQNRGLIIFANHECDEAVNLDTNMSCALAKVPKSLFAAMIQPRPIAVLHANVASQPFSIFNLFKVLAEDFFIAGKTRYIT